MANPGTGMTRARDASRDGVLQRHQTVVIVVPEPAEHRGHAAQGVLRTGAAGFAQGDELGRDFDQQDVGRLERLGLGHDDTPFRPTPGVDAVGESNPHRAQARQGLRSADHWSASTRP